jgi:hypothetical protein
LIEITGCGSFGGATLGELLRRGDGRQVFACEESPEKSLHFLVNQAIGGQIFAAVEAELAARESSHSTACLGHQQNAGGCIPGVEVELPEGVHAATSYVSQVERGRTGTAHAMRPQGEFLIKMDVRTVVALVAGKARGNQGLG